MGQAAAWKGARLKRLICLTLSAVIVVGLLFAVAFIMIPSLRASGNECVRNVPAYVEKIEQWWTNVVQLAAKYNAALPEYAIDAEALTEKITVFINREGTGESAENGGSERDSAVLTLPEFIYLFPLQLALGIRLAHGRNRPHGHAGIFEDARMECQTGAEKERTPSTIH